MNKQRLTIISSALIAGVGFWFLRELFFPYEAGTFSLFLHILLLVLSLSFIYNSRSELFEDIKSIRRIIQNGINLKKDKWYILIPVLLFLIPMLFTLFWDLPYHYHPGDDEYIVPSSYFARGYFVESLEIENTTQNPLHENQQLMYVLLTPFFYIFESVGELFFGDSSAVPLFAGYFFLARLLNYIIGVLAILTIYYCGKQLFHDKLAASVASSIFAVSKIVMHHAWFMRSDLFLTYLMLILLFVAIAKQYRKVNGYIAIGILIGLGTALKPYILAFLTVPAYFVLRDAYLHIRRYSIDSIKTYITESALPQIAAVAAGVFSFFHLGRPYHNYIQYNFGSGFNNSLEHSGGGHYGNFPSAELNSITKIFFSTEMLSWWIGSAFLILVGLGIVTVLVRLQKDRHVHILLLFALPLFFLLSQQTVQAARFFLVLMPSFALLVANLFYTMYRSEKYTLLRPIAIGFICIVMFQGMYLSYGKAIIVNSEEDIRLQAAEWITETIPFESKVYAYAKTSWQRPKIDKNIFTIPKNPEIADYLVVATSDLHIFEYSLRHPEKYTESDWYPGEPPSALQESITQQTMDEIPETLQVRETTFELVTTFNKEQSLFGLPYNEYHDHPASWEMWAINNPKQILVYQRVLSEEI